MTEFSTAELEWRDNLVPVSSKYDDVYYSLSNGLAESAFVFLNAVGGSELWKDQQNTVIGETGFGTGLNFLVTWKEWKKTSRADQHLTFVSVEGFPLSRTQLQKSLKPWDELGENRDELIKAYPDLSPGFHTLEFERDNVTLILLFGDVREVLTCFSGQADAWFLDGFAPKKNPDMWNAEVYELLAAKSKSGTKLASFTAAGHVRRGLEDAGFKIDRRKGYAFKRERIVGVFSPDKADEDKRRFYPGSLPWFDIPKVQNKPKKVAVVGAGIVGNCLAYSLSRAGVDVTLIDKASSIAEGASGNPAAVFEPKLMRNGTVLGQYLASCYLYALRFYRKLEEQTGQEIWHHQCGSLDLIGDDKELQRRQSFVASNVLPQDHFCIVDANSASEIAGINLTSPGVWYPYAGCLNTTALAMALTRGIDVRLNCEVTLLEPFTDQGQRKWKLSMSESCEDLEFDSVVLANAFNVKNFAQPESLSVIMNRGQVSTCPPNKVSANLKTIVNGSGYITPAIKGQHVFGATFERLYCYDEAENRSVIKERHDHNLSLLNEIVPEISAQIDPLDLGGRTSVRGTTFDRLPLVGPVYQEQQYRHDYAGLKNGQKSKPSWPRGEYYENLFCAVGFGSRGFLTAPLMANYLVKLICGFDALPISTDIRDAIHPARFLMRDIKKGL
ncbi:bifunctional tRNA (5-methylaminomethyl-2-thiouridine)(34)-methyltransferase MnmD/FAD-dependent 5-carboxymethylaminomethyl-2-thiouridine(34) oxidoreductase MnmC [uncultured Kiloniella sp.]|uniref:bifunctional tRNA (5-methylaminomethyl-2-thiouridine)(34)-methyltransferase MnmD/FAD-dependent 5-carboxymethylaminomethyl-2-thiouridine(34) oxidoreductase MnmC n=1 Tax=uncultured Kiloniella sp. TaxID=1133091 RepID=UPI002639FE23|nr:bifunctional tRNA (5-methylaminomethyl-2-thiouridine)(34)-methyltransferase MnmD/FAD-dependent 5-carboxymethylaminomethyl-2-thiouridine(34) oxidoreductase MnmC [uncultured Kiloniella sp.]